MFKTFCSHFYCNQLWCNYNASSLKAAHIAFNNVYRRPMNDDYYAIISILFVNNRLDNFYVLRRKSIYNFLSRLKCSEHELLKNITESQYFSFSYFIEYYNIECENTAHMKWVPRCKLHCLILSFVCLICIFFPVAVRLSLVFKLWKVSRWNRLIQINK